MPRPVTIKDILRESQLFKSRAIAAMVFVVLLTLGVVARMVYLQVVSHEHFSTLSQGNRVKILPIPPTRGLIYDRNGVLLADNQPSYTLEVVPEQVKDMDLTLARLREIIAISDDDLERFNKQRRRQRRFDSIPISYRLSTEEVARFAVQRHRFTGVDIHARLYRYYPYKESTAHVLGYVGRIDEKELKKVDASNYSGTSHIGKNGLEKTYEDALHGTVGYQRVETNAQGRIIRVLERTQPQPGMDLHLTLDIKLQQAAEAALGEHNGAVVAIDPESGGVLALVSKPGFDPNLFVNGISRKAYRAYSTSGDKPLFNRSLRGQYPPGSTIKPLVGLAMLEHETATSDESHYCPGFYSLPNTEHRYRDWKKTGHGKTNLDKAIQQSCDVYFYITSQKLGINRMHDYLGEFGLGKKTELDITGELSGLNPSRSWKKRVKGQPWYPGETLITSIGQGYSLSTPLQLAQATATLARRGERLKPRLVEALHNPLGQYFQLRPTEAQGQVEIRDPANWDQIIESMRKTVHGIRGTARKIGLDAQYQIAGKTGTAQVFTVKQDEEYDEEAIKKKLRDHALFVSFAPVDKPRIAVAVIAENGGSGSSTAAPIARKVMDTYLVNNPYLDEPASPAFDLNAAELEGPQPEANTP